MTKIIYRRAQLADVDQIVDLAVESVSRNPFPVKIDREAMAETARSIINPAHFLWVAEQAGKVVAAFAACAQKSFWYRGLQVSVMLYWSRVPGAGFPLIRRFAEWCKSRNGIKVAVVELEPDTDPRLVRAMKRLGFDRESINLAYVRPQGV